MQNPNPRKSQGASLLEVMVALLIMSLGLLGMAGLQAATAKYRVNVQSHSAVAQLVSELTERMRVNPEATGSSFDPGAASSDSKYHLVSAWSAQQTESLSITKNCEQNVCSVDERADFDMKTWRGRVRSELPQGAAMVEGNRKEGIEVTLMWMDKEQTESKEDSETGETNTALKKARICENKSESTIVHNCCPENAEAPEGVRCLRMAFFP